jgi:hypothetical protein
VPTLAARESRFGFALTQSPPVVPLDVAKLDEDQQLAQSLALADGGFVELAWSVPDRKPLRSEIVDVRATAAEALDEAAAACRDRTCYDVVMYNHAENMTTVAVVDVDPPAVLDVSYQLETQPELNEELQALAWQIALHTPAVLIELGISSADAPLPHVERVLRRTACEQSRRLCAAPTFVVGDRALWVIVDLTEGGVMGMRWTSAEDVDGAPPTESVLLGENIDTHYCRQATSLARNGWEMDYIMTRSDGLRLLDVRYQGEPVLRSTKVVDWHVAYDREEAFGYSDAVGCPFFSSAAVVAMQPPVIEPIREAGAEVGFSIVQDYVHPLWPAACMYNYRQHYQFFDDGRFRIAVASNGGGCGNDGTYRPVQRIVPAGDGLKFSEWDGTAWVDWEGEGWQLQDDDTPLTPQGYQYRLSTADGSGYFVEPGRGQFGDGGRGDQAFVFVTAYRPDEGDDDMFTIGPCCNTDYHQGPEKYIEPEPEAIEDEAIVVWYVPQLKNDDTPGSEYCWASSSVEDGLYVTQTWPCYAGPMFVPLGG